MLTSRQVRDSNHLVIELVKLGFLHFCISLGLEFGTLSVDRARFVKSIIAGFLEVSKLLLGLGKSLFPLVTEDILLICEAFHGLLGVIKLLSLLSVLREEHFVRVSNLLELVAGSHVLVHVLGSVLLDFILDFLVVSREGLGKIVVLSSRLLNGLGVVLNRLSALLEEG